MVKKVTFFFSGLLLLGACSLKSTGAESSVNPKAYYPAFSFKHLYFGESGGFAGQQLNFVLDSLGRIYRHDQNKKVKIDSIGHESFRQIDAKVRDLRVLDEINQGAGNVNYSLQIEGTNFEKSFKWKKQGQEVPRLLEDLHARLMQLANE